MMLNPFAAIVQQARHALIAPSHASAAEVLGSTPLLAAPIAVGLAVIALGFYVFRRRAPQIAEQL